MEIAVVIILIALISVLIGITGVGGVLLIPILVLILGMDTHVATGTVLASMILPSVYISWLYARRGFFDKNLVFSLGLGGLISGYAGGALKPYVSAEFITIVLAAIVILAGVNSLRTPRPGTFQITSAPARIQRIFLFGLGASVGLTSGLAGSGGAVLTVPIMIYLGYPAVATVCAGILFNLPAGLSASIPNAIHGYIDYRTLVWITLLQLIGMHTGVLLASKVSIGLLHKMVAVICIFTGIFLVVRMFF